jgi:amidase
MAQATLHDVQLAADRLGFAVPRGHEDQYAQLLEKTNAACQAILAIDGQSLQRRGLQLDYIPRPDLSKWPRRNVRLPGGDENPLRAWAWRADIGEGVQDSLLGGKSVVFKDTVCVAGVPLLFGTDAFVGYTREQSDMTTLTTADTDATVVTRILESGGRIIGKAACEVSVKMHI